MCVQKAKASAFPSFVFEERLYRISVSYAQKDPRFLFEKRKGQPREFWSLDSTKDGSTLPQDCVEEQLCLIRSNW